ncbi:Attractin-like protein 1 [Papilio machaon]|uniref:Attractin-like protein 1 n=1 Tax=Papilio machaon TaxID=76193 RepID=A0A0N1IIW0_PAPMA|nr:Attractin-like protein 1 [Papilio machaon]
MKMSLFLFCVPVWLFVIMEYHIEEGAWSAPPTKGWSARAGFGHSAAWDPLSRRVYVHAGLVSESEAAQVLCWCLVGTRTMTVHLQHQPVQLPQSVTQLLQ